MTIPANVARRAYQAAERGALSPFFYVRRFVSSSGGPDEYVFVTCRPSFGGAGTPLSLTDVVLSFDIDRPVLSVQRGELSPKLPGVNVQLSGRRSFPVPQLTLALKIDAKAPVGKGELRLRYPVEVAGYDRILVEVLTPASAPCQTPSPSPTRPRR
jgi:hypothetical protein